MTQLKKLKKKKKKPSCLCVLCVYTDSKSYGFVSENISARWSDIKLIINKIIIKAFCY